MDSRQQRGMAIAAIGGARIDAGTWRVASQTEGGRRYRVNPHADDCNCPDHRETGLRCKHVWAAIFTMTAEKHADGTVTKTARLTYTQDWPSYNAAQTTEKDTFMSLLGDLCATIPQPPQTIGRPRLPLSDMIYAMTFKVSRGSRRDGSPPTCAKPKPRLHLLHSALQLGHRLHGKARDDPVAARPCRDHEPAAARAGMDFAVDSSGFTSCRFERWLDEKHGIAHDRRMKEWVKAHVMVGTRTNVVTAVEITDWKGSDTANFEPLVHATAKDFDVVEVSADKAYLTKANLHAGRRPGRNAVRPVQIEHEPVALAENTAWARHVPQVHV